MAVSNSYTIDLTPKASPVVVSVSQYDEGRQITFSVLNNGKTFSLTGYSVAVVVRTRSTRVATMTCTVSSNTAKFSSTAASTLYSGRHIGELRITKSSGEYVGSCNFIWNVEQSPESDFIPSEDEENVFADMLKQALQASGTAASYLAQMQELLDSVGTKPVDRTYIFIGDSYGTGLKMTDTSANWINKTVTNLGLSSGEYYKSAIDGAGFVGQSATTTFLKQLQSISVTDKSAITDIVVCGGWNDGGKDSEVESAMESFMTYVRSNYPYAKVWLGYISWCDTYKRYTTSSAVNPTWDVRAMLRVYQTSGKYGFSFIGGLEYVLHNMNYFTSDGLHPNEDGQTAIAAHLASALLGGSVDVHYYCHTTITKADNINSAPTMFTFLHNDICGVDLYDSDLGIQIEFTTAIDMKCAGMGGSGSTVVTVCTFDDNACLRGGRYNELSGVFRGFAQTSDGINHQVNIVLRLGRTDQGKSNAVQVSLFENGSETATSNYRTISSVKKLWILTPNVFLRAESMFC